MYRYALTDRGPRAEGHESAPRAMTEDVLRKHNVTEDLGTVEDYLSDAATLAKLRTNTR